MFSLAPPQHVQIFNSLSLREALSLSADTLTSYFKFDSILPTGRQNTFFNMIQLIQSQLQRLQVLHMQEEALHPNPDSGNLSTLCTSVSVDDSTSSSCSAEVEKASRIAQAHTIPAVAVTSTSWKTVSESSEAVVEKTAIDPRNEEIAMLLSGGVDSSVALQLLVNQGHKVRAYYLKIWLEDEVAHLNNCPWEEDLSYATKGTDIEYILIARYTRYSIKIVHLCI